MKEKELIEHIKWLYTGGRHPDYNGLKPAYNPRGYKNNNDIPIHAICFYFKSKKLEG